MSLTLQTGDAASALSPTEPPSPAAHGWTLRARIQALVALLLGLFVVAALALQVHNTREAVHEEIIASNRIASQLLQRFAQVLAVGGPSAMLGFVQQLGRVRANEITLINPVGTVLYRSPPATYKRGRSAPAWFSHWVAPDVPAVVLPVAGGQLVVQANPSRAVVDGWDALLRLAWMGALALALLLLCLFALVRHALEPLARIEAALARMSQGDWTLRLPPLPGREAAVIGQAVNHLGEAVQGHLAQQRRTLEAQQSAARSREWALATQAQIDAERQEIARELHDEFGQSVTGIRALTRALSARLPHSDASAQQTLALIDQEAARLYDAMHGLIPRLTPLTLDALSLRAALIDLLAALRTHHSGWRFELDAQVPPRLSPPAAQVVYRVVQEALNNAIKHSAGHRAWVRVSGLSNELTIEVTNDGADHGAALVASDHLPGDSASPRVGGLGLAGLAQRVSALGGRLDWRADHANGRFTVYASWPLSSDPPAGEASAAPGALP